MGKFLAYWEVDTTKVPDKPEVRYENWIMLLNMVKKDMESGMVDWGMFAGRLAGYAIREGTEQDLALELMKYVPYIKFKTYPIISVDQVLENMIALSKA